MVRINKRFRVKMAATMFAETFDNPPIDAAWTGNAKTN